MVNDVNWDVIKERSVMVVHRNVVVMKSILSRVNIPMECAHVNQVRTKKYWIRYFTYYTHDYFGWTIVYTVHMKRWKCLLFFYWPLHNKISLLLVINISLHIIHHNNNYSFSAHCVFLNLHTLSVKPNWSYLPSKRRQHVALFQSRNLFSSSILLLSYHWMNFFDMQTTIFYCDFCC